MAAHHQVREIHGLDLEAEPPQLKCASSYYGNSLLLLQLQALVEDHLKNIPATMDNDNVKVNVEVKKETDERDLIKDKREFIVNFRLDFKAVCT